MRKKYNINKIFLQKLKTLIVTMQDKDNIGKTVDKYRIQSIIQIKPNNICIMRAINVTNNQPFVLKKETVDRQNEKDSIVSNQSNNSKHLKKQSTLLYNQVNNIKQICVPRILKCLQLLKTKRSLYLVYQNYPQLNLQRYLKQRSPAPVLKIRFAKIICEVLQEIHRKQYVYVNLMPQSIYVISGSNLNPSSYQLKFVGFQYAQKLTSGTANANVDLSEYENSPYLAPEVINEGKASHESDIYSAGKIFQLLCLTQIKGKNDTKVANQIINSMFENNPKNRSSLNKVWQCLKLKQNQARIFDHKILQLHPNNNASRVKQDTYSVNSVISTQKTNSKSHIKQKNIQQQERRLRKTLKVRSLIIYLHNLANFVLRERNKSLYYLMYKKTVIMRSNLITELKKMLQLYSGQHYNKLNSIKQILAIQQSQSLNLLSKIQQILRTQNNQSIMRQIENRNQLNQQIMQEQIYEFVNKKKKQIKPFHSILDQQQRNKLINLCGLAQKIMYGSFQRFFDEVMDDSQVQLNKQKYFTYLKNATTKQIFDRLQKTVKQKQK